MKNDAFELPDWSLDQALLWVATRDPSWIISGYSWFEFRLWLAESGDDERPEFLPGLSPCDAEHDLRQALQKGQVTGWNGLDPVEPRWFNRATYLPTEDKILIENKQIARVEKIAEKQGNTHQRRSWDRFELRLDPTQVIACFSPKGAAQQVPQADGDSQAAAAEGATRQRSAAGRKPKYDWDRIQAFVFDLFEEHGLPDPDDPEFSSNESVVNRVLAFCQREFKKEPGVSTVRLRVPGWISAHRERISRN